MDNHARAFNGLRPRLQKIAYRMLGSVAEAEDIVQDVWLRWHAAAREAIDNTEAWLVSVTTRMSIDRLRAAKIQREHYAGIWCSATLTSSPASRRHTSAAERQSLADWCLADNTVSPFMCLPRHAAPTYDDLVRFIAATF
ncbi:MAG: hypothetical protein QOJ04_6972, partial [Caballeronia sp.]|nr:hypothetical protein [Caballeronia sp.]